MKKDNLLNILLDNIDENYALFTKKLVPDTKCKILGVRTPIIRKIAKNAVSDYYQTKLFLQSNHVYHEEWMLHGLILGQLKINVSELLGFIDSFIPHIDNWSV